MAAVRLIAISGFVVLITLLEQTKPMEARRVKVVHIGPRVRKLVKKVDELKKEIASREQCEPCQSIKEEGFLFPASSTTADYIDAGRLSEPLDSFTLCVWIKFEREIPYGACIFSTGDLLNMQFGMYMYSGYLHFVASKIPRSLEDKPKYFFYDKWIHFCATGKTKEKEPLKLYVNGTLELTDSSLKTATIDTNEGNLVFGQCYLPGHTGFFDSKFTFVGKMAGFSVWDYAMSDLDIYDRFMSCAGGDGNVMSMADFQGSGKVQKIQGPCISK